MMRLGAAVVLFSFTFYIAAQFQAAGTTFASVLAMNQNVAIGVGAAVVLAYVWLGGFWAASITDSVQGLLMGFSVLLLPLLALIAVGGPGELLASMAGDGDLFGRWTGQASMPAAIGFVMGLFGIGLGYPGQPHVVNRFMAIRDAAARDDRVVIAQRADADLMCESPVLVWRNAVVRLSAIGEMKNARRPVIQKIFSREKPRDTRKARSVWKTLRSSMALI